MEKKVLIIAYYWPPSGGSGVQRWLKFVKYLPSFGWTPYVFTPENPSFAIQDATLEQDVPDAAEIIRFPIWEPYQVFHRLSRALGNKKSGVPTDLVGGSEKSLLDRVSGWIRGNLFVPDPRIFWVRPSVKFLHDFLMVNDIGTIVTTGPPHSLHLIGYHLKRRNPSLRWLADFRDPWSEWGLLDSLTVGTLSRTMHRRMEGKVLRTADRVTTITPFYVRRFEALSGRNVSLLTNGYDEDDFRELSIIRTEKFVIRHVGTVNEKCDPRPFMQAVLELSREHPNFGSLVQVDFVGAVHSVFKAFVQDSAELLALTTFTNPVPHRTLISMYGRSSLLLLILTGYKDAEGYMPGKLFEYLATGLPIFGTGPEQGDANNLLKRTGAGEMINGSDTARIKQQLAIRFLEWTATTVSTPLRPAETSYTRKDLTRRLTELL